MQNDDMKRFERNIGAISDEEQKLLSAGSVFVAGCGGLGGFVVEYLVRLGVGKLVVCDKDEFDESNLNRQLLATTENLGKRKAECARERAKLINPDVNVTVMDMPITQKNAEFLLDGVDVVVDCLDSVEARLILENNCELLGLPLVAGAVHGWVGQITTVFSGDKTLSKLYRSDEYTISDEQAPPVLSFTAATIAALEAAEAAKVLLKRPALRGKLLVVDLDDNTFDVLNTADN